MSASNTAPPRNYRGMSAEHRARQRREQLLEAGLQVYGSLGYAQATVRDICQHAGLTERYFYESFSNKEDLLVGVYEHGTSQLKAKVADILADPAHNSTEKALLALTAYFDQVSDPHRGRVQQFEVLGVSSRVDTVYRSAMQELAEMAGAILRLVFAIPSSRPVGLVETGVAGAMIQIANAWILDGYKQPVSHLVNELALMLLAIGRSLEQA